LIFIGILNDADQTGQKAVSYIADKFQEKAKALITTLDRHER
jgi:hypothetical protein